MPGRLPTIADFANKSLTLSITPPPSSHAPINILILLHGLGDTHAPFSTLGQQLNLPETACISIRAPKPVPFDLGGYDWGDDITFSTASDTMEKDTGFRASTKLIVEEVIQEGLIEKCSYTPRDIILFGYAQGGMVALQVGAEMAERELGGVVCVGGWLPEGAPMLAVGKTSGTPALLCKAATGSEVPASAVARMKETFRVAEVREWKRRGEGMPRNREEMLPIMQFFARRLRSRRGVPADAVELT